MAFAEFLKPLSIALGSDIRPTSEELKQSLAKGSHFHEKTKLCRPC